MAVYTKEYESQPEAILTNVIICPAVDLSANVAVPVHCQVENVLWDTGATNTLISQEVVNALGLQPKNKALISSAGGDVESWTYLVHVILPTGTAELNVQALLNDNSDYDVVIGMDIINSCDFCYTNKDGKSTFSKHSLSTIKYRTFATERVLWMVMQITAGCYILFISNS